jgi:thioredoxin
MIYFSTVIIRRRHRYRLTGPDYFLLLALADNRPMQQTMAIFEPFAMRFYPLIRSIQIAGAGLLVALVACADPDTERVASGAAASSIPPVESAVHWERILSASGNTLLVAEFYADWCGPCRKLAPVFEELSEAYHSGVRFYRIDVEAHRDLAARYRVRGIPFTVLIKNRKVVDSLLGLQPKSRFSERIERFIGSRALEPPGLSDRVNKGAVSP